MALTNLQQAFQVSGSGFDRKLSAIVGIGQSIKQSQVAKQRMAQELDQKKELIQFREEAKAEAQKEVLQQKAIQDRTENAKKKMKEYLDIKRGDFSEVSGRGIFNPQFRYEYDEQDRIVDVGIYTYDNEGDPIKLSENEFINMGVTFSENMDVIDSLESGIQEGRFPETAELTEDGEPKGLTMDGAKDILNTLTDPSESEVYKRRVLLGFRQQYQDPNAISPDETGDAGSPLSTTELGNYQGSIVDLVDDTGTINFTRSESAGFLRGTEKVTTQIPIQGMPVSAVMSELEGLLDELELGEFRKYKHQDVSNKIVSGDTEGLDGDAEELASRVNELMEQGPVMERQLKGILDTYRYMDPMLDDARNRYKDPAISQNPKDNLYIDLYGGKHQTFFTAKQKTALQNLTDKYNQ